jgi:hypothetical protein
MPAFYWERHPDGPFVTLIAVATTYLHPEVDDIDAMKRFAKQKDNQKALIFKSELREALRDPSQLPGNELSESVQYDDGSPEAFMRNLWRELYGDEPWDTPSGPTG